MRCMFRPKGIFGSYEFSLLNLRRDIQNSRRKRALQKAEKKEAKANG